MDVTTMQAQAAEFHAKLRRMKAELRPSGGWYPFDSMGNLGPLETLLGEAGLDLDQLIDGRPVADIGGGDGDCAFFLESLGHEVHLIDHPPTNHNDLEGARLLKEALGSSVEVVEVDLDSQFALPGQYNFAFFLGLLYHLKNPYYALEALSKQARYCFLSTRIARFTPEKGAYIGELPVAYLLSAAEMNGNDTNYWIFSPVSLRRIVRRSGWHIHAKLSAGEAHSEPARPDKDERMFMLLESCRLNPSLVKL